MRIYCLLLMVLFFTCISMGFSPVLFENKLNNFAGQRVPNHLGTSWGIITDPNIIQYVSPDFIWDLSYYGSDLNEYKALADDYHEINPTAVIGYYHSACLAMPEDDDRFAPAKLHIEDINDESWYVHWNENNENDPNDRVLWTGTTNRYFLNITDPNVREAIITTAIDRAQYFGLDAVSFDNCAWGIVPQANWPSWLSSQEWTDGFMAFYQRANLLVHAAGLDLVVNVGTPADKIDDAFQTIYTYVDGLMTEMAFHPNVRADAYLEAELDGYEAVLAAGKDVYLMPLNPSIFPLGDRVKYALTRVRSLVEKYGTIYVCDRGSNSQFKSFMYSMGPLYTVHSNLIKNGDFGMWDQGLPSDWIVTGESGDDPNVREVGFIYPGIVNAPADCFRLQDHTGALASGGFQFGQGACNLYSTDEEISLSQYISTLPGEEYAFSVFIGQGKANDDSLVGTLIVEGDGGELFSESYTTYGVKWVTFTASDYVTCLTIKNNTSYTTDISFDDVAVWMLNNGQIRNLNSKKSYYKIQSAIDAADDGDEIVVFPGTYYEEVDLGNWSGTLRSIDPDDWDIVAMTVINGGGDADSRTITSSSPSQSPIITGLSITNADYGIKTNNSSILVENCFVYDCYAGIYIRETTEDTDYAHVSGCKISDCHYGLYSYSKADVLVKNCWIYDNEDGAGITWYGRNGNLYNNTIVGNYRGIKYVTGVLDVANCIVWGNNTELYDFNPNYCSVTYSCIEGGYSGVGNIDDDPNFLDPDNDDYHIASDSPCIDVGDNSVIGVDEKDIDGDDRIIDGGDDPNAVVDMGADEYNPE